MPDEPIEGWENFDDEPAEPVKGPRGTADFNQSWIDKIPELVKTIEDLRQEVAALREKQQAAEEKEVKTTLEDDPTRDDFSLDEIEERDDGLALGNSAPKDVGRASDITAGTSQFAAAINHVHGTICEGTDAEGDDDDHAPKDIAAASAPGAGAHVSDCEHVHGCSQFGDISGPLADLLDGEQVHAFYDRDTINFNQNFGEVQLFNSENAEYGAASGETFTPALSVPLLSMGHASHDPVGDNNGILTWPAIDTHQPHWDNAFCRTLQVRQVNASLLDGNGNPAYENTVLQLFGVWDDNETAPAAGNRQACYASVSQDEATFEYSLELVWNWPAQLEGDPANGTPAYADLVSDVAAGTGAVTHVAKLAYKNRRYAVYQAASNLEAEDVGATAIDLPVILDYVDIADNIGEVLAEDLPHTDLIFSGSSPSDNADKETNEDHDYRYCVKGGAYNGQTGIWGQSIGRASGTFTGTTPTLAIDLTNSQLVDESGVVSADWTNRTLNESDGTEALDWESRYLRDDDENLCMWWGTSQLVKLVGDPESPGNNTYAIIGDWNAEMLYDENITSGFNPGKLSIDWDERILYATDGTTPVLDWTAQSANEADASESHSVTGTDTVDQSDLEAALNALGAKVNAIFDILMERKLMAEPAP